MNSGVYVQCLFVINGIRSRLLDACDAFRTFEGIFDDDDDVAGWAADFLDGAEGTLTDAVGQRDSVLAAQPIGRKEANFEAALDDVVDEQLPSEVRDLIRC